MAGARERQPKDFWDKLEVFGKLLVPAMVTLIVFAAGFYGDDYLQQQREIAERTREETRRAIAEAESERQRIDGNARLLAQLVSKREEAESALRKDMFAQIIDQFLSDTARERDPNLPEDWETLRKHVLNLEILTYNFHNSLDIGPLFRDLAFRLQRQAKTLPERTEPCPDDVGDVPEGRCLIDSWQNRLEEAAKDVSAIQVNALIEGDNVYLTTIWHDDTDPDQGLYSVFDQRPEDQAAAPEDDDVCDDSEHWDIGGQCVEARIVSLNTEHRTVELEVRVYDEIYGDPDWPEGYLEQRVKRTFWVSFFDFPMIDNIRLPGGKRLSVVLQDFGEYDFDLAFVVFDGSRASLKDRPYYEEVFDDLRSLNERTGALKSDPARAAIKQEEASR